MPLLLLERTVKIAQLSVAGFQLRGPGLYLVLQVRTPALKALAHSFQALSQNAYLVLGNNGNGSANLSVSDAAGGKGQALGGFDYVSSRDPSHQERRQETEGGQEKKPLSNL